MRHFEIRTGKSSIHWDTEWDVFEAYPAGDQSARETLDEALDNPIASLPLEKLAQRAQKPVVLLPDATREWQKIPLMAQAVLQRLQQSGCAPATWVIGVGTHRAATEEEMLSIFGGTPPEGHLLVSHDAMHTADLGQTTERGTPLCVNTALRDADLIVLIGGIVYHDLAGFSGGRKALFPGAAAKSSIEHNHSFGFLGEGFHPAVACGSLKGNPIHEDMLEFLELTLAGRRGFLLNVIPDGSGELHSYVAGDLLKAWEQGVSKAKELQTLWAEQQPDLIVVSCGGAPYDLELYQATKSLSAIEPLLQEGTRVLLVADLPEGMGSPEFDSVMRLALHDLPTAKAHVRAHFSIPGFIAAKSVEFYRKYRMVLLTSNQEVAFPGKISSDFQEALDYVTADTPPKRVLLVRAGNAVHLELK